MDTDKFFRLLRKALIDLDEGNIKTANAAIRDANLMVVFDSSLTEKEKNNYSDYISEINDKIIKLATKKT